MTVKLSVIVPVYNAQDYLEDCVLSILKQHIEDFEVILVNDGSMDKSGEICDRLKAEDSRIKVIHKPNEGLSLTREAGYNIAEGEWITFVDNDDLLHPNMFELFFFNLFEKDIDIICGGRVDLETGLVKEYEWSRITDFEVLDGKDVVDNLHELSKDWVPTPLWGKFYRRHLFEKINPGQYKELCPTIFFEDVLLTPMLIFEARKVKIFKLPVYLHREIKTSLSRSGKFSSFNIEQTESGNIVLGFLKRNGLLKIYSVELDNYYRVLLRNWTLIDNICCAEEEKERISIKKYCEFYLKDYFKHTKSSRVNKIVVMFFNIQPGIVGKAVKLIYKKTQVRW